MKYLTYRRSQVKQPDWAAAVALAKQPDWAAAVALAKQPDWAAAMTYTFSQAPPSKPRLRWAFETAGT